MAYLDVKLPASEGAALVSESNLKNWVYVSSKSNAKPNSQYGPVGRWVLTKDVPDPDLPGTDIEGDYKFTQGDVIRPDRPKTIVDGDKVKLEVKHNLDFNIVGSVD
jgi:hypothetical protein